ncbi:MAG: azurin [Chitinophagales bacterium]|nr:azurin [Chitinophagales bacterium]
MKKSLIAFTAMAFLFTACGNNESTTTEDNSATTEEVAPSENDATEADTAAADDSEVAELTIEGNDAMQYNVKTLEAKAGQKVKLTLVHTGKAPKSAMGHNVVIVKQGVDVDAFANAAIAAQANDYIPADKEGDIIAHTALIGGGETTSVEFTAPAAGIYDFFCSFPGHHGMMKGKFIVE